MCLFPPDYQERIKTLLAVAATTDSVRNRAWNAPWPTKDDLEAKRVAERQFRDAASNATYLPSEIQDRRCVGLSVDGDIIRVSDLWREAAGQFMYEIEHNRNNWSLVAARAATADDARQCADDLGLRVVASTEEARAELERVGLGGLVDGADLAAASGPLWRLRQR